MPAPGCHCLAAQVDRAPIVPDTCAPPPPPPPPTPRTRPAAVLPVLHQLLFHLPGGAVFRRLCRRLQRCAFGGPCCACCFGGPAWWNRAEPAVPAAAELRWAAAAGAQQPAAHRCPARRPAPSLQRRCRARTSSGALTACRTMVSRAATSRRSSSKTPSREAHDRRFRNRESTTFPPPCCGATMSSAPAALGSLARPGRRPRCAALIGAAPAAPCGSPHLLPNKRMRHQAAARQPPGMPACAPTTPLHATPVPCVHTDMCSLALPSCPRFTPCVSCVFHPSSQCTQLV